MNRTQIYLPRTHHQALQREARAAGISMTELVRRIVADHVEGRRGLGSVSKDAVLRFVALGKSGRSDGSERHDAILDESLRGRAVR